MLYVLLALLALYCAVRFVGAAVRLAAFVAWRTLTWPARVVDRALGR